MGQAVGNIGDIHVVVQLELPQPEIHVLEQAEMQLRSEYITQVDGRGHDVDQQVDGNDHHDNDFDDDGVAQDDQYSVKERVSGVRKTAKNVEHIKSGGASKKKKDGKETKSKHPIQHSSHASIRREREAQRISRENRANQERMQKITSSGSQRSSGSASSSRKEGGSKPKSSSQINRQRYTDRIAKENKVMAQRLDGMGVSPFGSKAGSQQKREIAIQSKAENLKINNQKIAEIERRQNKQRFQLQEELAGEVTLLTEEVTMVRDDVNALRAKAKKLEFGNQKARRIVQELQSQLSSSKNSASSQNNDSRTKSRDSYAAGAKTKGGAKSDFGLAKQGASSQYTISGGNIDSKNRNRASSSNDSVQVAGLKKQVEELQEMHKQLEDRNHKLRSEIRDNKEEALRLERESDEINSKIKRSKDYKAHLNGAQLDAETSREMEALSKVGGDDFRFLFFLRINLISLLLFSTPVPP
jgi:hypothetical protein